MDAPVLGVLVRANREMRARAGRVTLVGVHPRTARLLRIAGLDGAFRAERVAS
jgi:anti-anti-sigma factor